MIKRGVAMRGLGTADIGPADTKHEEICFRSKEGGGADGKKYVFFRLHEQITFLYIALL